LFLALFDGPDKQFLDGGAVGGSHPASGARPCASARNPQQPADNPAKRSRETGERGCLSPIAEAVYGVEDSSRARKPDQEANQTSTLNANSSAVTDKPKISAIAELSSAQRR